MKERQRLSLFIASRHPALSLLLQALSLSFYFPSAFLLADASGAFPNYLYEKKVAQEHAEHHLTISSMELFPGSLLVGEECWVIYLKIWRMGCAALTKKSAQESNRVYQRLTYNFLLQQWGEGSL